MLNRAMYYSAAGTGYIQTPSFAIPNTGILTIEAWMKSKLYASRQMIFRSGDQSATVGYIWVYRHEGTDNMAIQYSKGDAASAFVVTNFFQNLDNQWIHITVVCDYTNKRAYIYKNGIQFETTFILSGTPQFPLTNAAKYIGSYSPSSYNLTDGSLDEVRIYNRGLSAEEVLEHYNGIFKDESNLQLYYNFNETSGTTVLDQSGNGRNGTMYGSTSREDFPPRVIL